MGTIFDIQNDILRAFYAIEENDGYVTPEIEETLAISKENLIAKVKSYVGVIKTLENDKGLIKEEIDRLKALEKAKTKSIDWLKQTLINAIESFGDTDKKGKKFIDYGIGKVSISTREVVEINESEVEDITKCIIDSLVWFSTTNRLSHDFITTQDILDCARDYNNNEKITLKDLEYINLDINLSNDIANLINTEEGFELLKAVIKYNKFNSKVKADKTSIKAIRKEGFEMPYYAKIVDNKSLSIK